MVTYRQALVAAALSLAATLTIPAVGWATCNRQDRKGMHVQIALTGAPIIFRGSDSQKWYVSIAATPEMRFKVDFGCWPFMYLSGGWSGLSQLVYGTQQQASAAGSPQQLGNAPVHAMIGLGLDVPKVGEHAGTTTSFGAFVFGIGYGNFKVGDSRLDSGPAIIVGFVSSLVTLNFPYEESAYE